MSGSSKVPPPPSLSQQELSLIEQQKLSLEQFNRLLSDESLAAKETQDILKNVSGLYRSVTIPESIGPERRENVLDVDKLNALYRGDFAKQAQDAFLGAKNSGQPITQKEALETLRGQVPDKILDRAIKDMGSLPSKIKPEDSFAFALDPRRIGIGTSQQDQINWGFTKEVTTPGERIAERTELQLDKDAVANLRQRIQENMTYQDQLAARDREIEGRAGGILEQLLARQEQALQGKLPVDPAILDAKKREFAGVKENLTRRGYQVVGDDPDTAVAVGTPAVDTLERFKQGYRLLEDSSRRGELDAGVNRSLGTLGLVQELRGGSTSVPGAASLNYLTSAGAAGPSQFLGAYPALTSGYGALQQPFANQRAMGYNASMQNAALSSQRQAGILGLGGTLGSAFLMAKLLSTKSAKKNIHRLTSRQENKILNLVRKAGTFEFDYKDPKNGEGKRIGIIAEEAPELLVTKDRKAQDVGNTLNILLTSVRALDRKVTRLTSRRAA